MLARHWESVEARSKRKKTPPISIRNLSLFTRGNLSLRSPLIREHSLSLCDLIWKYYPPPGRSSAGARFIGGITRLSGLPAQDSSCSGKPQKGQKQSEELRRVRAVVCVFFWYLERRTALSLCGQLTGEYLVIQKKIFSPPESLVVAGTAVRIPFSVIINLARGTLSVLTRRLLGVNNQLAWDSTE